MPSHATVTASKEERLRAGFWEFQELFASRRITTRTALRWAYSKPATDRCTSKDDPEHLARTRPFNRRLEIRLSEVEAALEWKLRT